MITHQIANSQGNYNYNAYLYRDIGYGQHFHGNFELIYVYDGSAMVSVNGSPNTLCPGDLLLLPPYTIHALEVSGGKTWVGVFSEDFVSSYAQESQNVLHTPFRCRPEIEQFLQRNLFFQGRPEHYLHIACLYLVCSECARNATPYPGESHYDFFHQVISQISNQIDQEITMRTLANAMNYEYHYFSYLFHQCFSMNFKEFINYFRFEQACTMINTEHDNVTDIADKCGFGSVRNFNRVFKKLSGMTPSEYRSQHEMERNPQ